MNICPPSLTNTCLIMSSNLSELFDLNFLSCLCLNQTIFILLFGSSFIFLVLDHCFLLISFSFSCWVFNFVFFFPSSFWISCVFFNVFKKRSQLSCSDKNRERIYMANTLTSNSIYFYFLSQMFAISPFCRAACGKSLDNLKMHVLHEKR